MKKTTRGILLVGAIMLFLGTYFFLIYNGFHKSASPPAVENIVGQPAVPEGYVAESFGSTETNLFAKEEVVVSTNRTVVVSGRIRASIK